MRRNSILGVVLESLTGVWLMRNSKVRKGFGDQVTYGPEVRYLIWFFWRETRSWWCCYSSYVGEVWMCQ